jgi:two-component system, cell cycle response regulator DivK
MKPTLLIIEDNEQNLYLMRYLLEKNGFAVLSAPDGRTGIDMALERRPDLILLDIQLPVMDGYSVAAAIRASPDLSATPIIAVTSYAMLGDREKCLAAGATDYVEKPINADTLVGLIRQHLGEG